MGWFLLWHIALRVHTDFRPRVGMGWFSKIAEKDAMESLYFRPRVGMGWFARILKWMTFSHYFRPRLGMGWFKCWNQPVEDGEIFVPAWGWVGSEEHILNFVNTEVGFSSPSGDGMVLQILTEILKNQVIRYRHNKQLQTDR